LDNPVQYITNATNCRNKHFENEKKTVFKKIYVQYWLSLTLTNFSRLVVYYCLLRDCNIEFENKKTEGSHKVQETKNKSNHPKIN